MTYTGKAVTQSVVVKKGTTVLKKDTDYTVSYRNNKNAGKATLIITGKGSYKDTVTKTFKITKAKNTMTVNADDKTVSLSKIKKKAQTVKNAVTVKNPKGKVSYKLTSVPKDLKNLVKISSSGVITINKWQKAKKASYKIKIKVTAEGNDNYNKLEKAVTVTIKVN